jgi:hypothetical protein
MTLYINSPQWFAGVDSVIELLSIIVAFMVCLYSYKVYRLTKQKNYFFFSGAFFLVGVSYIFKIISELVIYSRYVEQKIIGPFIVSRTVLEQVTWVHTYSHTIFRLLLMFAFFILLVVALKVKKKQTLILLTYFMVLVTLVSSYAHFVFHLTHVIMLSMLVFHFYHNYLKRKTRQALFVTLAFLSILISHIVLVFMMYDPNIYAIGEVFQLIGFGILLYAFILVTRK